MVIATQSESPPQTETRIPKLAGALNFRDMGGYSAADGRHVRWNRLYRSGTTHAMTEEDLTQIAAGGIRYAYDLRSNSERRTFPSRLAGIAAIEYWFRDHDRSAGQLSRLIRTSGTRPERSRGMMLSAYRQFPYDFREAYQALFQHLINGQLPLVFNCMAGKDRTGVAAALVLTALGVPRDIVVEDYLLTEQFFDRSCEILLGGKHAALFAGIDREVWEPVMHADAAYLHAMFDELNATHGSVGRYLSAELGIDRAAIDRLHANLLS